VSSEREEKQDKNSITQTKQVSERQEKKRPMLLQDHIRFFCLMADCDKIANSPSAISVSARDSTLDPLIALPARSSHDEVV
jgi:hypothetical protein